jgi:hypothetical protein
LHCQKKSRLTNCIQQKRKETWCWRSGTHLLLAERIHQVGSATAVWNATRPFPARGYLSFPSENISTELRLGGGVTASTRGGGADEQPGGEGAQDGGEKARRRQAGHGIRPAATARNAADQDADAACRALQPPPSTRRFHCRRSSQSTTAPPIQPVDHGAATANPSKNDDGAQGIQIPQSTSADRRRAAPLAAASSAACLRPSRATIRAPVTRGVYSAAPQRSARVCAFWQ